MLYVGSWARLVALVIVSLSLIACQKQEGDGLPEASSVVASVTAEFPGVVLVSLPGGNGICTGTVVSTKAVLTAAHCTKTAGRYSVIGNFGTKTTYDVVSYGPGVVDDPNDIAILMFADNTFDSSIVVKIGDSVSAGDTLRLVGFGCNDLNTRKGAGVKRTGTNVVADIEEYVEFITPAGSSSRGILGASNRAGSCFGDSGGPALKQVGNELKVVAVTHAGGQSGSNIISQYVNVGSRNDNRNFIASANTQYNLGIAGF